MTYLAAIPRALPDLSDDRFDRPYLDRLNGIAPPSPYRPALRWLTRWCAWTGLGCLCAFSLVTVLTNVLIICPSCGY